MEECNNLIDKTTDLIITDMCRDMLTCKARYVCLWLRRHNISHALTNCHRYHESLAKSLALITDLLHQGTMGYVASRKDEGSANSLIEASVHHSTH